MMLFDLPLRALPLEPKDAYLMLLAGVVAVGFICTSSVAIADEPASATTAAPAPASDPVAPASPPAAEPQRFYIRKFRVDGTRSVSGGKPILTNLEIQKLVYPFMGPYRTTDDVEQARQALEKAYQAKGYQTVSVETPVQSMTDVLRKGVVVLKVDQFPVGRLRVVGSRYYLPSEIKSEAPELAEGNVPNFNEVTKNIVSLNQLPDRQVTPVLKAGDTPGTVDIDLNVKDKFPFHGSVELNNRNSVGTTPLRVNASADYDNLWQMGHSLSISYQVAPENPQETTVFSGSYLARIPGVDGLNFLAYGFKSDSNVASLGSVNVAGRGDVIGGRAIITLPSEKGFSENVSLGLDYKKFDQDVDLGAGSSIETPVTYFPLSATYSASWQGADGSLTQLDAGLTLSLRGLGGSSEADFNENRTGASGNFIYFRGDLSRLQPLPKDFQIYGKLQAQVADEPLVNSEQISGGGLDTVRGYYESEVLGDNGMVGQIELRTPSIGQLNPNLVNDWRFYVFADAAELGLNDALPEQQTTFNLASVGFGSRIKLYDHFNGSFDAAFPLIAGPDTAADSWHLTFRLWATF